MILVTLQDLLKDCKGLTKDFEDLGSSTDKLRAADRISIDFEHSQLRSRISDFDIELRGFIEELTGLKSALDRIMLSEPEIKSLEQFCRETGQFLADFSAITLDMVPLARDKNAKMLTRIIELQPLIDSLVTDFNRFPSATANRFTALELQFRQNYLTAQQRASTLVKLTTLIRELDSARSIADSIESIDQPKRVSRMYELKSALDRLDSMMPSFTELDLNLPRADLRICEDLGSFDQPRVHLESTARVVHNRLAALLAQLPQQELSRSSIELTSNGSRPDSPARSRIGRVRKTESVDSLVYQVLKKWDSQSKSQDFESAPRTLHDLRKLLAELDVSIFLFSSFSFLAGFWHLAILSKVEF